MKETVATDFARCRVAPPAAGEKLDDRDLRARSQIVWGEHCSECAYPLCYAPAPSTTPRPDLHCRRFERGIEDAGSGLTRIRFRKWGKLEGLGPAPLRPPAQAARRERADRLASRLLAGVPFVAARRAARLWNGLKGATGPVGAAADAFVVEGWSLDGRDHGFTLTFLQADQAAGTYQTHFRLGPDLRRLSVRPRRSPGPSGWTGPTACRSNRRPMPRAPTSPSA